MHNAILITSHKRPECSTVKSLKKAGYTGEWYIVADDLDPTDYEGIYHEHVIRFCKKEYLLKTDTIDNFSQLTSHVYAYNASFDIAKQLGLDCYGVFDDDLTDFCYRYLDGKKLVSRKITKLSPIFDAYCKYILDCGFACGAFISNAKIIGGSNNSIISQNGGFYHSPTNTYIVNSHIEQIKFKGTLLEDCIHDYLNNVTGKLCRAFMPVFFSMPKPESLNEGGNKELYSCGSSYITYSYANIAIPSLFKWTDGGGKHNFSSNIPRIISEKWRKV